MAQPVLRSLSILPATAQRFWLNEAFTLANFTILLPVLTWNSFTMKFGFSAGALFLPGPPLFMEGCVSASRRTAVMRFKSDLAWKVYVLLSGFLPVTNMLPSFCSSCSGSPVALNFSIARTVHCGDSFKALKVCFSHASCSVFTVFFSSETLFTAASLRVFKSFSFVCCSVDIGKSIVGP